MSSESDICNICFDSITKETGKVQTSCNHLFHYYCLTSWFYKEKIQLEGTSTPLGPSSCPCCRKKFSMIEDLPTREDLGIDMSDSESEPIEESDEDMDSQSYMSEESVELYTIINFSELNMRITFNTEQEERVTHEDIHNDPDSIATKIQAVWKGYRERSKYFDLLVASALTQMSNG